MDMPPLLERPPGWTRDGPSIPPPRGARFFGREGGGGAGGFEGFGMSPTFQDGPVIPEPITEGHYNAFGPFADGGGITAGWGGRPSSTQQRGARHYDHPERWNDDGTYAGAPHRSSRRDKWGRDKRGSDQWGDDQWGDMGRDDPWGGGGSQWGDTGRTSAVDDPWGGGWGDTGGMNDFEEPELERGYERGGFGASFHDRNMSPTNHWDQRRSPSLAMARTRGLRSSPMHQNFGDTYDSPYSSVSYPTTGWDHARPKSAGAMHVQERAPGDWRRDFSPRTGIASFMPRRRKSVSIGDKLGGQTTELHKYLRYNHDNPNVKFDLRYDPSAAVFRKLGRPTTQFDLTRFACEPPVPSMRIYHSRLPWYIEVGIVQGHNPAGVTFYDLFSAIYSFMMTPIRHEDYYNTEMDEEERRKVSEAFFRRVKGHPEQHQAGSRRVDFLQRHVIFEGLVKGRNGCWEMKTNKA